LLRDGSWLMSRHRERLGRLAAGLQARSPLATLGRGYALVTAEPRGPVLRDAAAVQPGARIRVRLQRGALIATVDAVERAAGDESANPPVRK
jgi:exodeoxyribonuclease VII large subunit